VRVLEGPPELLTPAPLDLGANSGHDETTPVLVPAIDLGDQIAGKRDGDAFEPRHDEIISSV
jgi:hypothetical protein